MFSFEEENDLLELGEEGFCVPGQEDLGFHPELVEGDFRVIRPWLLLPL